MRLSDKSDKEIAGCETARWTRPSTSVRTSPRGYTLIEILVVLTVMGLGAALAAPAFIPRGNEEGAMQALTDRAREIAIRREESMSLHVESSGAWRIDGQASETAPPLATGHLPRPLAHSITLIFSPLGTCGPEVESTEAAQVLGLNPLTCEARAP
jgi:prepilin-type N-terminal cleavage/methylation domain-containing protein